MGCLLREMALLYLFNRIFFTNYAFNYEKVVSLHY